MGVLTARPVRAAPGGATAVSPRNRAVSLQRIAVCPAVTGLFNCPDMFARALRLPLLLLLGVLAGACSSTNPADGTLPRRPATLRRAVRHHQAGQRQLRRLRIACNEASACANAQCCTRRIARPKTARRTRCASPSAAPRACASASSARRAGVRQRRLRRDHCSTAPCAEGEVCVADACVSAECVGVQCPPGTACAQGVCRPNSCGDGAKSGTESDVDCGGPCAPCNTGRTCGANGDCLSGSCRDGRCESPVCTDGRRNGGEADVDCGGACPPCGAGQLCFARRRLLDVRVPAGTLPAGPRAPTA